MQKWGREPNQWSCLLNRATPWGKGGQRPCGRQARQYFERRVKASDLRGGKFRSLQEKFHCVKRHMAVARLSDMNETLRCSQIFFLTSLSIEAV
jgi:hypothetical protein